MSRAEITTPEALTDDSVVELSLRPRRLEEFIGFSRFHFIGHYQIQMGEVRP
jgi:hypothetical protein